MWVGNLLKELEDRKKQKENYLEEQKKIEEQIVEHFGGTLVSHNLDLLPGHRYFATFGVDILTKRYGYCEHCYNYIGVPAAHRKTHDVLVLNSYCKEILKPVKPLQRCRFWEPNRFYQLLMLREIRRNTGNNPEYLRWICPDCDDGNSFVEEY